jgi:acetyl esterase
MSVEDELDPWFLEELKSNPRLLEPFTDMSPEMLALARGPALGEPARHVARVTDDEVDGIPIRIYQHEGPPAGLVVYFHGGGHVAGSIGVMDNVARELAHAGHVAVVSVEYRLAPEHPFPAGLDDCERVTRWAHLNVADFDAAPQAIVVAGESAGGNLAAAVTLRLRDSGDVALAGQVLIYPATGGPAQKFPSRDRFDGLALNRIQRRNFWSAYAAGRDLEREPHAVPLSATSLAGLPPALVQLGGCDMLRDEGHAYAERLRADGVDVHEICYPGQPHGFVNLGFPIAEQAFADVGQWIAGTLARRRGQPDE